MTPPQTTRGELFDRAAWSLGIRHQLAVLNISGRKAAETAGVHYATFNRVARGKGDPDIETYLRIERWLSTPTPDAKERE